MPCSAIAVLVLKCLAHPLLSVAVFNKYPQSDRERELFSLKGKDNQRYWARSAICSDSGTESQRFDPHCIHSTQRIVSIIDCNNPLSEDEGWGDEGWGDVPVFVGLLIIMSVLYTQLP